MPFYFPPSPDDGATVRNSVSGITYTYRDAFESWIIEGGGGGSGTPNVISETEPTPIDEFPAGSIWYKPSEQQLYIQNNGAWEICAPSVVEFTSLDTRVDVNETILNNEVAHRISGDEALRVKVQDTAPTDPIPNLSLWFDSTDLELLLYYNDGDSNQWIPCSLPLTASPDFQAVKGKVDYIAPLVQSHTDAIAILNQAEVNSKQSLNELESRPVPDVDKHYVDVADTTLQSEIDRIEAKVDELETKAISGAWNIDLTGSSTRGAVLFYKAGLGGGVAAWGDVVTVAFNPVDAGGVAHTFDEVAIDEVIRFRQDSGADSAAAFKVTNIASQGIYEVDLLQEKGAPSDGELYDIEFLPSFDSSSFATLDYVDNGLDTKLNKAGDTMKGALVINNGSQFDTALEIKAYDGSAPDKRRSALKIGADGKITSPKKLELAKDKITWSISDAHYLKGQVFMEGLQVTNANVDAYQLSRFSKGFVVKKSGESIGGDNVFTCYPDRAAYKGMIKDRHDLVNKQYVDDLVELPFFKWVDPALPFDSLKDGECTMVGGELAFSNTDLNGKFAGNLKSTLTVTTGLGFLYSVKTLNSMSKFYEPRILYIAGGLKIGVGSNRHNLVQPFGPALATTSVSIGETVQLNVPGWL
jgi:hypothetical protein